MALRRCPMWAFVLLAALCGARLAEAVVPPPPPGPQNLTTAQTSSLSESQALKLQSVAFANGSEVLTTWNHGVACPDDTTTEYKSSWEGVTCLGQNVVALNLSGLALGGELAPQLSALEALQVLDLSHTNVSGNLPAAWQFPDLHLLRLGNNWLTGVLPEEWGDPGAFASLELAELQGNALTGQVPAAWWDLSSFNVENGTAVYLRPGNPGVCGAVVSAGVGNATNLQALTLGLMAPEATVTVTNTLGSCLRNCGDGDDEWATIVTNVLDLCAAHNVSMLDVLVLNPDLSNEVGERVALPCYAAGYTGYWAAGGSDLAFMQAAGGYQVPGVLPEGPALAGNMTSGRIGAHVFPDTPEYSGSVVAATGQTLTPQYWFVDLTLPVAVSSLLIQTVGNSPNFTLYVGNDTTSVTNNVLVDSNLSLGAAEVGGLGFNNGTAVVGRYVVLAAGGEAMDQTLSLGRVEVYATVASAVRNKPVMTSDGQTVLVGTDGSVGSCVVVQPSATTGLAWVLVDLGYTALVSEVAAALTVTNSDIYASIFVTNTYTTDFTALSANMSCGMGSLTLGAASYQASPCYLRGRYVALVIPNQSSMTLCELEVYLGRDPNATQADGGDEDEDGSRERELVVIIVPTVLGIAVLAVAMLLGVCWWRQRRNNRRAGVLHGAKFATGNNVANNTDGKASEDSEHLDDKALSGGGHDTHLAAVIAAANSAAATAELGRMTGGSGTSVTSARYGGPVSAFAAAAAAAPGPGWVPGNANGGAHAGPLLSSSDVAFGGVVLGSAGLLSLGAGGTPGGAPRYNRSLSVSSALALNSAQGLGVGMTPSAALALGRHHSAGDSVGIGIGHPGSTFGLGSRSLPLTSPGGGPSVGSGPSGRGVLSSTLGPGAVPGTGSQGADAAAVANGADLSLRRSGGLEIVDMGQVEFVKPLGEGSFGQVWLARYCHTDVALKMLTARLPNATASAERGVILRQLEKEASLMATLLHPNCCRYLGLCLDPPCLMMEYCARKSVDTILAEAAADTARAKGFNWLRLLSMCSDAAKGMYYLHNRKPPVLHRDLKSANLLVDSKWQVKIADFNLSRTMDTESMMSTICITNPRWLAPEILRGGQATLQSDVWAFGTVMWELMTWKLPFANMNPYQIINLVQSSGPSLDIPGPDDLPAGPFSGYDTYVALMRRCWSIEPADRPDMAQVAAACTTMHRQEAEEVRLARAASSSTGKKPASRAGVGSGSSLTSTPRADAGGASGSTGTASSTASPAAPRSARIRRAAPSPFLSGPSSATTSRASMPTGDEAPSPAEQQQQSSTAVGDDAAVPLGMPGSSGTTPNRSLGSGQLPPLYPSRLGSSTGAHSRAASSPVAAVSGAAGGRDVDSASFSGRQSTSLAPLLPRSNGRASTRNSRDDGGDDGGPAPLASGRLAEDRPAPLDTRDGPQRSEPVPLDTQAGRQPSEPVPLPIVGSTSSDPEPLVSTPILSEPALLRAHQGREDLSLSSNDDDAPAAL